MRRNIERVLENSLTVRQLVEILEMENQDARCVFVCNYGDYSNTQQALPIGETIDGCSSDDLYETAYSHSHVALREDDGEPDEDETDAKEDEEESIPLLVFRA